MRTMILAPTTNDGRYDTREGWKLVDKETLAEIKVGDQRTLSEGEIVEVTYLNPPHKASSQGKVCVRSVENKWSMEYYASVVGGEYQYKEDAS